MDGISVTTEGELRRELRRAEGGGRIVLSATEWKLDETVEIASREVCLEGATNGVVVHCPPDEKGSAVVVRCAALLLNAQRGFFRMQVGACGVLRSDLFRLPWTLGSGGRGQTSKRDESERRV